MKKFDVIIIGGGHNGLVAACVLSKKGKKVLVIEKNEKLGGLANYAESLSYISKEVIDELNIKIEEINIMIKFILPSNNCSIHEIPDPSSSNPPPPGV